MPRSRVKSSRKPVMTISRSGLDREKIVYVLKANKPHKYKSGERSHIYCIGTTKKGEELNVSPRARRG